MKRIFIYAAILLACLSIMRPVVAQDRVKLEIGYMPILPVSQLFVALDENGLEKAGIDAKLVRFQNGPAMVQAILAGQLDIAYFGIGPAMVARAKGADIKVVASCIVEQISFIALKDLAASFEAGDKAGAFARFAEKHGRKPVIATFPVGSVPETVLQYWLRKQLKVDPAQVEIIYQGAAVVQQSLLTGAVDGAAILEPVVSIAQARRPEAVIVAKGSELFPKQPGAVLAVREGLIEKHPEIVSALVALHDAATEELRNAPEGAADAVQKYVGGGRLDKAIVVSALKNSASGFVADPDFIVSGTTAMRDFQAEIGTLKAKVDLDALFDPSFYRSLKKSN
jgi:NitT/TauT family transport system substrate-binding protein